MKTTELEVFNNANNEITLRQGEDMVVITQWMVEQVCMAIENCADVCEALEAKQEEAK